MLDSLLQLTLTASSIDQAVSEATGFLGCSRADIDVDILAMPSKGFLGILGKKEGAVRVRLTDRGFIAKRVTEHLLDLLGIDVRVDVHPGSRRIDLIVHTDNPNFLIGRHGNTLYALESLVTSMTDRYTNDRTLLVLDVGGYRERRTLVLNRLAYRLCSQVRKTKRNVVVPSMPLVERKIFYGAIKDEQDMECRSLGQGNEKKLVLSLKTR